jgi:hypothetical protein
MISFMVTLMQGVVDPDPCGSAVFLPFGSWIRIRIRINVQIQRLKIEPWRFVDAHKRLRIEGL